MLARKEVILWGGGEKKSAALVSQELIPDSKT